MAYGQPYPMTYGTPYFTPGQPAQDQLAQLRTPYQQQSTGLNWVQGETGAKSYLVAPGNTVLLMDSESQTFYLKSADPAGMPSMRIFDYTERTSKPQQPPTQAQADYVTREEFNALVARLEAPAQTKKKTTKEAATDEPSV